MRTIRGPGLFLAQFMGEQAPFNSLKGLASWAAELGYRGVQLPTWNPQLLDLRRAAESAWMFRPSSLARAVSATKTGSTPPTAL